MRHYIHSLALRARIHEPCFANLQLESKTMNRITILAFLLATTFIPSTLFAQAETEPRSAPDANVLDAQTWKQLDNSVERGLAWLLTKQRDDGSFETIANGQPAVTSFCLLAFLANGESPSDGQYKQQLSKAVDFIMAQQTTNGLIALGAPNGVSVPRKVDHESMGVSGAYNHAISALALAEVYGHCEPAQAKKLAPVIEQAIVATLEMQSWGGKPQHDVGGWRYLDDWNKSKSDLSITGWQLMFLRSAKGAGFDTPETSIDAAVQFVENCFLKGADRKVHGYTVGTPDFVTRAMAGAGVLALAHAGKHNSKEALASADWILKHDFSNYNVDKPLYGEYWSPDRYHYGAVICTQAMFQIGGKYWEQFFPPLVNVLLANQKADGSWPPEIRDAKFGSCYTTSLSILSLSVPNQMLPIFQR